MENPEEVLQALDEFQKMRPTEIPRELEDYLSWVAKTGDPVYQWSLIKALFREKLARVMTDFYESCPTLELTPCQNVEHFNYDTMKSSLLERLESFANAPFTVQRICELLTAPRKEYNRVDKFMRAIEKNILVVSTREPGQTGRRSENADSMVNGSVEDEQSMTQPPHEVEMESWVKDCTSAQANTHSMDNETTISASDTIPSTTPVKSISHTKESIPEKSEQISSIPETTVPLGEAPSTLEFVNDKNITNPSSQAWETPIVTNNPTSCLPSEMAIGIIGEVPDANINEDTSSQPSLELDSEDNDNGDSSSKLQTTFEGNSFASVDDKSKLYESEEHPKPDSHEHEKVSVSLENQNQSTEHKEQEEKEATTTVKLDFSEQEFDKSMGDQKLLQSDNTVEHMFENNQSDMIDPISQDKDEIETEMFPSTCTDNLENSLESSTVHSTEKNVAAPLDLNPIISQTDESLSQRDLRMEDAGIDINIKNSDTMFDSEEVSVNIKESFKTSDKDDGDESSAVMDNSSTKPPIVEEPISTENIVRTVTETTTISNDLKDTSPTSGDNIAIEETTEIESKVLKSMVPEPMPIIEEPKDATTIIEDTGVKKLEDTCTLNNTEQESCIGPETSIPKTETIFTENYIQSKVEGDNDLNSLELNQNESSIDGCAGVSKVQRESNEFMEVDNEESISTSHQDEPMEQEATELSKS